jgi:N-acetylglucosaminyl-diphospho-decaprenol L-rhamnosyltransferase
MSALVSIVIPVYNQVALLDRCLASLARQEGVRVEPIVVDDASPEDPAPVIDRHSSLPLRFIRAERNLGYAEANNRGLQAATGDYILFLNSDTELPADALARLVNYLECHPEVGGVAPLHRGTDGEVQRTCYGFPTLPVGWVWDSLAHRRRPDHPVVRAFTLADWDHQSERDVEHAQTSCLLVRREVYDRIGGMDPKLFLFYNDTDFCFRMSRAGYPIRFVPEVEILHHGSASVQTFDKAEAQIFGDRYRYFRKWYGWRGALAVRCALWSRVGYEALVELAHGDFRFAAHKLRRGFRLSRAMGGAR